MGKVVAWAGPRATGRYQKQLSDLTNSENADAGNANAVHIRHVVKVQELRRTDTQPHLSTSESPT